MPYCNRWKHSTILILKVQGIFHIDQYLAYSMKGLNVSSESKLLGSYVRAVRLLPTGVFPVELRENSDPIFERYSSRGAWGTLFISFTLCRILIMYPISIILILYYNLINFSSEIIIVQILRMSLTCSISYGVNLYLDLRNVNKFKFKFIECLLDCGKYALFMYSGNNYAHI
jgi:hypothetical protein